ncbi:Hypothetical protein NTJ_04357 [Nesidiocoris tenuis]|nr:Hypothetical protein NTJ_04357 [Nesidiocoris tenuis]
MQNEDEEKEPFNTPIELLQTPLDSHWGNQPSETDVAVEENRPDPGTTQIVPRQSRMSVTGHTQQNTNGAPEEPKSAPVGPPNESTSISNQSPKLIRTPRNRRPPERYSP